MRTTKKGFSSLGSIALLIAHTLQKYECDPAQVFQAAGIDPKQASASDSRYPADQMRRLWKLCIEATNDPCFGFIVGQNIQPASLQGLGFSILSSDTLGDALIRMSRYSRLVSTAAKVTLEDRGDNVDFVVSPLMDMKEFGYTRMDFGIASALQIARTCTGQNIEPIKLQLMRPRPSCAEIIDHFIKAPVIYDAKINALSFSKEQINLRLQGANPELARINDQSVIDSLVRFDKDGIALQVSKIILEKLQTGTPHQEDIARSMNISLRSLQRKLQTEDTNFNTLLDTTRKELAINYLRQPHRTLGEITYQLGFSAPANFTRAFKRWTGKSPTEFRES